MNCFVLNRGYSLVLTLVTRNYLRLTKSTQTHDYIQPYYIRYIYD